MQWGVSVYSLIDDDDASDVAQQGGTLSWVCWVGVWGGQFVAEGCRGDMHALMLTRMTPSWPGTVGHVTHLTCTGAFGGC